MKNLLFTMLLLLGTLLVQGQEQTYQLSTHILDIAQGQPATGVTIRLEKWDSAAKAWTKLTEKQTDSNGRIKDLLPGNNNPGVYKLTFYTKGYFEKQQKTSFYPFIEVAFEIKDNSHYHVPITLSAFGYSTYRGN
ncbi:hydroxyisourate hydrolase [Cnuella takakiae]|nr:hydroxyisourate hydrolase [Cnuella takakiae]